MIIFKFFLDILLTLIAFLKIYFSFKKVVFVFQMGKVGSQTINHTLKKIGNLMVFHDHSFSIKQSRERNKNYILIRALYLCMIFKKKIYVICPIRDPLKRNLSMFINQILLYPSFYGVSKNSLNRQSISKLSNIFNSKFDHEYAFNWMDLNILLNFNIDVYQKKFDKKKGFQTYNYKSFNLEKIKINHNENLIEKKKNIELLIIKSELSNKSKIKIISNFLKIKNKININIKNQTEPKISNHKNLIRFKKFYKLTNRLKIKYSESRFYKNFY